MLRPALLFALVLTAGCGRGSGDGRRAARSAAGEDTRGVALARDGSSSGSASILRGGPDDVALRAAVDGGASAGLGPPAVAPSARARAADLSARIATARSLLGPHVRVQVAGDLFVLVDCGAGSLFDASVTLARRALAVLLDGRLAVLPDEAVTAWIVGSPERYAALLKSRVPEAAGSRRSASITRRHARSSSTRRRVCRP